MSDAPDGPDSTAPETLEAVVAEIRDRVDPTPVERDRLRSAVADLTERTEEAVADLPVAAEVVHVGSTARNTWIAGDRDIDLFVAFPPAIGRETLAEYGLQVGHAVLPDGHEEYAEHPYVAGEYESYDVDLVPCFDVETATEIRSAVDRTPFHSRYLDERLDADLAADVRVCKQFCKAVGVYGSDLQTRGFSGFLVELLVCEYDGFRPLVAAAADWHPPVELDPEGHGRTSEAGGAVDDAFGGSLVVVDPTDPGRNVAAVCSAANVARFQHYARHLLDAPRTRLFEPDSPEPLDAGAVRDHVARRGTTPLAVRFGAPDIVDDQLWPQLEKSLDGFVAELDRRGFDTVRAEAFADETAALFVELAVAERPAVERHGGPPVHVREHASEFYDTYAGQDEPTDAAGDAGSTYGPFISGERYVVEREREFASAREFCTSDALFDVALGVRVASALEANYEVLVGDDVGELAAEFGTELARYFAPEP
jgi:tRNA nucleotidyltransferase (CCA-adding enzyme)